MKEKTTINIAELLRQTKSPSVLLLENNDLLSFNTVWTLVHELRVHQIELEMQNEELRRSRNELEFSQMRYIALYDQAPTGYLTISENGLILEANLTFAALLLWPRDTLFNQPISTFIFKEDQDIFYLHRKQLFEKQRQQQYELRMINKDGRTFYAQVDAALAWDAAGQPVCRMVITDISKRKQVENEMEELNKKMHHNQRMAALGVMSGGIAHEIRNPLAICASSAQFLTDEKDMTPEFIRECAENIRREIRRASAIIENLLRYSHPRTKQQMSPVNLIDLLGETLLLVDHYAKRNKVETKVFFGQLAVSVQGVDTLLQQAFLNLFQNAINAMPNGGMLRVDVCLVADRVEIRVSDTGCGIQKENLQKIFDPFYTTSAVGSGTGLGLSICYSAVKEHAGTIDVTSIEGKGSTFTVKLPLKTKGNGNVRP
jgi:PAS domain S-box-containing protein